MRSMTDVSLVKKNCLSVIWRKRRYLD